MWLGTPVIATAYGGVLDFCHADNSILCSYDLVPVVGGLGVYTEGAPWADIDHGELVAAMRSVRDDDSRREAIIAAARLSIEQQPDRAAFGRRYADLLAEL
jgi:glycosyltransferase involved in cell wall biosynthesis